MFRLSARVANGLWVALYSPRRRRGPRRPSRHLLFHGAVMFLLACIALDLLVPYALFCIARYFWRVHHNRRDLP